MSFRDLFRRAPAKPNRLFHRGALIVGDAEGWLWVLPTLPWFPEGGASPVFSTLNECKASIDIFLHVDWKGILPPWYGTGHPNEFLIQGQLELAKNDPENSKTDARLLREMWEHNPPKSGVRLS